MVIVMIRQLLEYGVRFSCILGMHPFQIAQKFKSISSKVLREEFPELKKFHKKRLWAPSNYHGSVGVGYEAVENYVRSQDEHHKED